MRRRRFDYGVSYAGLNSATADWYSRVLANGGTVSAVTLAAVNTFEVGLANDGLWAKMLRINLFCGNQLQACIVPLMIGAGSTVETVVNFVGGDYTEAVGLAGNGTTKYLNTGFLANDPTLLQDSRHLTAYVRVAAGLLSGVIGNTSTNFTSIHANVAVYRFPVSQTTIPLSSSLNTEIGYFAAVRTASNAIAWYKNGSSVTTGVNASAAPVAENILVFNGAGGIGGYTLAGYTIGLGLTPTDVTNLYNRLLTFNAALGR